MVKTNIYLNFISLVLFTKNFHKNPLSNDVDCLIIIVIIEGCRVKSGTSEKIFSLRNCT